MMIVISLFAGVILSVGSGFILTQEMISYPAVEGTVERSVPGGGWPVRYLHDSPGVSREGQLSIAEDRFIAGQFVLDALLWSIVVFLLVAAITEFPKKKR